MDGALLFSPIAPIGNWQLGRRFPFLANWQRRQGAKPGLK